MLQLVLALSVALQLAAALIALRLTRLTGAMLGWGLVATAIGLMALRRAMVLWSVSTSQSVHTTDLATEAVALLISVTMVVGLLGVGSAFEDLRYSRDRIETAQALAKNRADQLEELNRRLLEEGLQRSRAEAISRGHTDTLTRALAQLESHSDLDEFLLDMLHAVVDYLEGAGGELWVISPETEEMRLRHAVGIAHDREDWPQDAWFLPGVGEAGQPPATRSWDRDTPGCDGDMDWLAEGAAEVLAAHGVARAVQVSMKSPDGISGWLAIFFHSDPRAQLEEQIQVAETLTLQANLALRIRRLGQRAEEAAVLQERNRLAREIHDTLAQGFAGVLVQLMAIESVCSSPPEAIVGRLERIRELSQLGLEEARRSVWALRPRLLAGQDLITGLERLADTMTRGRTERIRLEHQGLLERISVESQDQIFRIAQEAFANVLQHAGATSIS